MAPIYNTNTRLYIYKMPSGKLYLIGDDNHLKCSSFNCSNGKKRIDGMFKKGISKSIDIAINFLDNFFSGKTARRPILDLSPFTKNEIAVYRELLKIPFGKTISYNELAGRAGIPNGARFAGNAMAKNNFPIFIPCHRVIGSNGGLGGFSAGLPMKKFLLEHETAMR